MTLGTLAAKLGVIVINHKEAMPYQVEVNGEPIEAVAVDHKQGIIRVFTLPYDKAKSSDDGIINPDLNLEEKQYVLFG